jgi:PAS domain S-box-containing protein
MSIFGKGEGHKKGTGVPANSDFLLKAIQDGVVMVDRAGLIQVFNPAAATITGWTADEALGLDYRTVIQLIDDRNNIMNDVTHPFAQALASGKSVRASHALLATRHGKPLPISLIVSPEPASGGVVGVFRDTTKETQEEQALSDFISTASHEMRTPLAAIEGYLALALNPKTAQIDNSAKQYLEKASSSTKHLGDLFRDLLTSSKAEDGRLISYPSVVDIGQLLEQVADASRLIVKDKSLELRYSISSDTAHGGKAVRPLYYIYADPNRIREVLENIIDNAIKYTSHGSIQIRLTGDSRIVQVQVSDSGVGIAAEDIPHLFQKFYRIDNSATRTIGGTGLGLFICKKIVELYNGRIWVESQPDKGSTFFINLPRLDSQQALRMPVAQPGPEPSQTPLDGQ